MLKGKHELRNKEQRENKKVRNTASYVKSDVCACRRDDEMSYLRDANSNHTRQNGKPNLLQLLGGVPLLLCFRITENE